MPADITGPCRAENRVGHGVTHGVGVGVSRKATIERNRDPGENERTPGHEPVKIVARPGPAGSRRLAAPSNRFRHRQVRGSRDLDVRRLAADNPDRVARLLGERRLVGGQVGQRKRVAQDGAPEGLRRLREKNRLAIRRGVHHQAASLPRTACLTVSRTARERGVRRRGDRRA